jgi:hypothetical protein
MKQIKNTEQARSLHELGYSLYSGVKDVWGRTWKFGTLPDTPGGHGHFDNLKQVDKYIKEVRNIRQIYQDIEEGLI